MIDLAEWPALVLTAGLATRLRPLSDVRAKAAMPVAGTPIIARILEWLHDAGIRRVVLNLHHKPDTIATVVGDGSDWGVEVRYSWERIVLGTAGGPRHALALLEGPRFFVINGDTLTDCNLRAIADQHVATGARVTMAVVPGDVARYGGVLVAADGTVRGFGNALEGTRALHFIGVQAVEADVFAALADNTPCESIRTVYPPMINAEVGAIRAFVSGAEFLDVGTARDYIATVATIAGREGKPFDVGARVAVAPEAVIERTILWDDVQIGQGAQLINCIAADNVVVAAGARYENSVLVAQPGGLSVTAV
jgi:mannose-1-phosphate guanylyltransferase